MLRGLIEFNRGLMRLPVIWRLWVLILVLFNLVVPLFFTHRTEALIALAAFALAGMAMAELTRRQGFTRLLGLGHIFWIPMLIYFWTRLEPVPATDAFGLWLRAVMIVNALSLVLDTVDVVRYARGERDAL